ncbi:zinc-binding protein A33-like isoform X1 [Cyprinus carpio]|uniref:Zinc-binding protein A33-like isoform X1 n=1 Tax=Cyprinus carpio TaxID=7962 RepID=A0A9R0ACV5_CYPCA|nr:zinc-binding protein A33-like isoform X1 [Cyprinus carpio]
MQNLVEQLICVSAPVTLDPDTASGKLLVSQDCTSVQYVEMKLDVFDNTKRLHDGVLASQGFSSGVHCWDTEVGDNNNWTLAVMGETVNRKKKCKMNAKNRFWCFRNVNGKYKKGKKPVSDIDSNERPNIIRLQLAFDKGELRFIDPSKNRSLCTYTGGFPEKVFPYFCTEDVDTPLSLFPANTLNI